MGLFWSLMNGLVTSAIAAVHLSGILHQRILENIDLYIDETPNLRLFLGRLRNAKKKVFD